MRLTTQQQQKMPLPRNHETAGHYHVIHHLFQAPFEKESCFTGLHPSINTWGAI